jgi:hypothetical protein
MSRSLVPVLVVALSALAGCASSARQAAVPCSIASQVPASEVAEAPPSDFEMEVAPRESTNAKRLLKDAQLTGSLHPSSPTRTNDE